MRIRVIFYFAGPVLCCFAQTKLQNEKKPNATHTEITQQIHLFLFWFALCLWNNSETQLLQTQTESFRATQEPNHKFQTKFHAF